MDSPTHAWFVPSFCFLSFSAVRLGKPELGVNLFTSESLQFPGFVEFDDVNKKIITFNASLNVYKVWQLADYSLQYQISDKRIDEIKISPGVMLVIHLREKQGVPFKLLDIETGAVMAEFTHQLALAQKVQYVEQFNEKLLIKQKKCPLQIIDVTDAFKYIEVAESAFPATSAFIFLYENPLFLTFTRREIDVWNFKGKRVARFEDHYNWYPDCNTSNIYISQEQDLITSYCLTKHQAKSMKRRLLDPADWRKQRERTGEIHVSHVFTGRCIAKIAKMKKKKYPFELLSAQQQKSILEQSASRNRSKRRAKRRAAREQASSSSNISVDEMQAESAANFPTTEAASVAAASTAPFAAPAAAASAAAAVSVAASDHATLSPTSQLTADHLRQQQRSLQLQLAHTQQSLRMIENSAAGRNAAASAASAASAATTAAAAAASSSPSMVPATPATIDSMDLDEDDEDDDEDEDEEMEEEKEVDEDEDVLTEPEDEAADTQRELQRIQREQRGEPLEEDRMDDDLSLQNVAMPTTTTTSSKPSSSVACASAASSSAMSAAAASSSSASTAAPPLSLSYALVPHWDLRTLADYRAYNAHVEKHNRALKNITAVFYHEGKHELYTGNKSGRMHVWRTG